jgi:hypothetical protein
VIDTRLVLLAAGGARPQSVHDLARFIHLNRLAFVATILNTARAVDYSIASKNKDVSLEHMKLRALMI